MEDSTMDFTAVCSSGSGTKPKCNAPGEKQELLLQENYELKNKVEVLERVNKELENEMMHLAMNCGGKSDLDLSVSLDVTSAKAAFQENHELKKRIEILEKSNIELESEINYLTHKQAKDTTRLLSIQEELDIANSKIKRLQSSLEEEQIQSQRMIEEAKEAHVTKPSVSPVIVPDQEQLNILTLQIEKLEKDDITFKESLLDWLLQREFYSVEEYLERRSQHN